MFCNSNVNKTVYLVLKDRDTITVKDTHRENTPSNKTPVLKNVQIWVFGTLSLIYKRFLN